jgi:hypothetical protein
MSEVMIKHSCEMRHPVSHKCHARNLNVTRQQEGLQVRQLVPTVGRHILGLVSVLISKIRKIMKIALMCIFLQIFPVYYTLDSLVLGINRTI